MHGTFVQGYSTGAKPMGYSTLAALYNLYKVLRYEIEVTAQPQNSGDTLTLCMFPVGNEEIPSSLAANLNLYVFQSQPKFQSVVCANGVASRFNTLKFSQPVHELLGKREAQWMDLDGTILGTQPGTDTGYFGIYLQAMDGAVNSAPICVSIRLRQVAELTDLIQQIS